MLQNIKWNSRWIAAWCLVTVLGCAWLIRLELDRFREAFETDARIAHRLLSQRVVQLDAVMSMLSALQPVADASRSEQRLSAVYPQILGVQRRTPNAAWSSERLQLAEADSRRLGRAVLAGADFTTGVYQVVLGANPASYAMQIDMRSMVPSGEWPMPMESSPVRVTLEYDRHSFVLQPGRVGKNGWDFGFRKQLAAPSQPFDLVAVRQVSWSELPWSWMIGWALAVAIALAALKGWQRQRHQRRRAEELLRLGQVARLNMLGELAAGMAHELNQPLTAILANTQAASRLLNDDPPELETARGAMQQAAEQARRASDVVGRMRRAVERPDLAIQVQAINLQEAVDNALYLLEPECNRRSVVPAIQAEITPVFVMADPVALEQIIHNLIINALQALEQISPQERTLTVITSLAKGQGLLTVHDSGPGIPQDVLPRLFEPFFTTRKHGLGLGLSLCETLATGMNGTLEASNHPRRGALFTLKLPIAAK
jgi:signal transduction histidine kinase